MPTSRATRREFLVRSAAGLVAAGIAMDADAAPQGQANAQVDTHVYLGRWPFGRLRNDEPAKLAAALRAAGITQAWAGPFEALLHKDLAGVNARLAADCRRAGDGLFIPFGAVNPTLPDWEDDLRRCREEHGMPGVRLHPTWHGYGLDDIRFGRVLQLAAERRLIVQVACDPMIVRRPYLALPTAPVGLSPLAAQVQQAPGLRMILLNQDWSRRIDEVPALAALSGVYLAGRHSGSALKIIVGEVSAGPLMIGSCAPHVPPLLRSRAFESSGLTKPQQQLIAHGTASELLAASAHAP